MPFIKRMTSVLIIALFLFSACGSGKKAETDEPDPIPSKSLARLKSVKGSSDLSEAIKKRMILAMEARIDSTYEAFYENSRDCWYIWGNYMEEGPTANDDIVTASSASANDYSTTNNQTEGVDEADFVKNDGKYIYIVTGSSFKIIDAWPPETANIISSMDVEGDAKRLYVYSDKAVIYSSIEPEDSQAGQGSGYNSYRDCSYGYNCDFIGDGKELKITIFNIDNPRLPVLVREVEFSGSYINARRIDNALHTVVSFPEIRVPGLNFWPDSLSRCIDPDKEPDWNKIKALFEELKITNRQMINAFNVEDFFPEIKDTKYTAEGKVVSEDVFTLNHMYESQLPDGNSILTVASLDLETMADIVQSSVIGRSGAVYASGDGLYIASKERYNPGLPWFYAPDVSDRFKEVTTVHRFSIQKSPAVSVYDSSCAVKGRVLNQFSMDEHNGALRIATTSGWTPSPEAHNTLSVLMKEKDELSVVGVVDKIAVTEDIRSVRFDGDKGYMVTFKKTDPLFVFDLAEPKKPRITAELKIPGFSTYMHLMDDDHLLTIGYDANDQGSFAWFDGIMLQIFDVSDMGNPQLTHKEIIGTRGSSSEGTLNHLAFNYFSPKDLLAIPMTICEGGDDGSRYGQDLTFTGLLIYDVTAAEGFSERARISHLDSETQISCNNWWTNANSTVKRSIFMDDYVFSIAKDKIKIAKLENPVVEIETIDFIE